MHNLILIYACRCRPQGPHGAAGQTLVPQRAGARSGAGTETARPESRSPSVPPSPPCAAGRVRLEKPPLLHGPGGPAAAWERPGLGRDGARREPRPAALGGRTVGPARGRARQRRQRRAGGGARTALHRPARPFPAQAAPRLGQEPAPGGRPQVCGGWPGWGAAEVA